MPKLVEVSGVSPYLRSQWPKLPTGLRQHGCAEDEQGTETAATREGGGGGAAEERWGTAAALEPGLG